MSIHWSILATFITVLDFKILIFLRFYLFIFRGEGREKERERNINVWLPLAHPLLGTWPTTQACALTGNQTSDPLVHTPVHNPLSHTSQGWNSNFILSFLCWLAKILFMKNFPHQVFNYSDIEFLWEMEDKFVSCPLIY